MLHILKEILFPLFCISCSTEGAYICVSCVEDIQTQFRISNEMDITTLISIFSFEDVRIQKMIHAIKYEYVESLWSIFETYIKDIDVAFFSDIDALVPIPLHKRRYAERGFNQAEEIAKIISKYTGVPVIKMLSRKLYTKQQALLSKEDRANNTNNAFVAKKVNEKYPRIMLVDDVYTTGATMRSCELKLASIEGIEDISGFVLARG